MVRRFLYARPEEQYATATVALLWFIAGAVWFNVGCLVYSVLLGAE